MADKKVKIVSYRRAEWLAPDPNRTLEKFIRNACTKLSTVRDRWITLDDQTIRLAKMKNEPTGGLRLHITTETEGEAASFIPKPPPASTEFALGTQPPPANAEWLDGDAFLYVLDNHVCICTTSMSDSAVKVFLWEYFKKAKLPDDAAKFDLLKKADITKIKLLRTQGVKEVEIRASMFKATATYQARKSHIMSSLGAVAKHVKAVLGKPHDVNPDALQVILTLKTDEREKGLAIGEKEIENIAADIVRHAAADDNYAIITKTGQKITPEELFVKTAVSIDRDGKTVNRDNAWEELVKFFDGLKNDGVLEQ